MLRCLLRIVDRVLIFIALSVLLYMSWRAYSEYDANCLPKMLFAAVVGVISFFVLGLLLYCAHRVFRKTKWRIVGSGILFVWAVMTCLCADLHTQINYTWLAAVFMAFCVAVMFSIFGRASVNWIRIKLTPNSVKNIFWGMSDRDLLLAKSIVRSSATAIVQFNLPMDKFYDPVARARLTDLADEIDALWMFMDFEHLGKKAYKGRRHFFLSENGHDNLAMADRIVRSVIADEKACSDKELYVRVGDIDQDEMSGEWARGVYEDTGHIVRPIIIHEPEMIARKFVQRFSPLSFLLKHNLVNEDDATVEGMGCRTLLLGFDHTGRALLNAYLCLSRYIGPDKKSVVASPVTVVDMIETRWRRYCLLCPEIAVRLADYGLDFNCMQVGYEKFDSWFRTNHRDYDRIVLCLNGDAVNIREAIRIRELLVELRDTEKEIIVRVGDPAVNQFISGRTSETVLPIKYFGSLAEIYSEEFFFNEPADKMAQVINWQWNLNLDLDSDGQNQMLMHEASGEFIKEQSDDIKRLWESASYRNRLSSRSSAIGALSFMNLIGVECVNDKRRENDIFCAESHEITAEELNEKVRRASDVLARVEHLRWSTYLFTLGIRRWDLENPSLADVVDNVQKCKPIAVPNSLANQTTAFRAHAALVDFDELPEIDLKLAEAVDVSLGERLKRDDFTGGKSRPDVGGGRHAASLQCKDYDCWSVFPEAAQIAGLKFFARGCGSGRPKMPEKSAGTIWGRITNSLSRFRNGLSRFRKWVFRKPAGKMCPYDDEHVSESHWKKLKRYAQWTQDAYNDKCSVPDGCKPFGDFLKASIVAKSMRFGRDDCQANKHDGGFEVFWFDDLVSPHWILPGMRAGVNSRYAYVYDGSNGIVKPAKRMPSSFRKKWIEAFNIAGRRVSFSSQPDFCAQVFAEDNRVVVIFRGTVTNKDWCENMLQCMGRIPPQFRLAADLVRAICETTSSDILLLGHSEGGGEVQYSLMKNSKQRWTKGKAKIKGVTFNSQRLSPGIMDYLLKFGADKEYAQQNIDNFRTGADVVSGWLALGLDLLGSVYVIGKNGHLWKLWAHKIKYFCHQLEHSRPSGASS